MSRILALVCGVALMIVAVHGAAVPEELAEIGAAARTECIKESGTTEELLKKAATGDFADDEKLNCYFKCVFDKFELVADDKINFDAMLDLVPKHMEELGNRVIGTCRNEVGKDLCETAVKFNKCFFKEAPEDFFLI